MAMLSSIDPALGACKPDHSRHLVIHSITCAHLCLCTVWSRKLEVVGLEKFNITDYVDLNALVPQLVGMHSQTLLVASSLDDVACVCT
jgi:hypothetical protein